MSPEERLQSLSAEELKQVLREVVATMPPEERLQGLSAEELKQVLREVVAVMPPEERLQGLSAEDRLRGLTPEQLEHLRELLEQRRPANGSHAGPTSP